MPTKNKTNSTLTGKLKPVRARSKVYLTKRILASVASRGFKEAAATTTAVLGYNVIVKDGWVVKKYSSGAIEQIKPIHIPSLNRKIVLD